LPICLTIATGRIISTIGFFHIRPITYCPAPAPVTHTVMVLIDTINLFIGITGAVDSIESAGDSAVRPSPSRQFDALGQIYTTTLPIMGDILNNVDAALLDDAIPGHGQPRPNSQSRPVPENLRSGWA
jgi:hypothetical protein